MKVTMRKEQANPQSNFLRRRTVILKDAGLYEDPKESAFNVQRLVEERVETSLKKQKQKLKLLEKARLQLEKDEKLNKMIRNADGKVQTEKFKRLPDWQLDNMIERIQDRLEDVTQ